MKLVQKIADKEKKLTAWRHYLHQHPEIAFEEIETASFLGRILEDAGLDVAFNVGKTGIVATLKNGDSDRVIGLRADMDALPITEMNTFAYASEVPGKMHACGHDGHMAMLLGAACYLAENRTFNGTVRFIFQPAEESEGGAQEMIEDGLFERFPVDQVYGMHNWPDWSVGQIGVQAGPIMAARDFFRIKITGKGCHGAMPHQGVDPIPVAAQVVLAIQTVISRNLAPVEPAVVTVTEIKGGETWNAIPEFVSLRGTARYMTESVQAVIEERVCALATGIAQASGAGAEVEFIRGYPPVVNTKDESVVAAEIAAGIVGESNVLTTFPPTMGAEDFAFMLQKRPGCYLWLGAGRNDSDKGLHNPYYDFNDEALVVGASFWVRLVEGLLQ